MKLTYETGIATLAQFIALSLLNIGTQLNAVIVACRPSGNNCLTGALSSTAYFMLIVVWFGIIWQLGYQAQKRRSRRLCQLLIAIELFVLIIAVANARHHNELLGLITSLTDAGLAIWVITLAGRLLRARGRRIVASERTRRRNRPDTEL